MKVHFDLLWFLNKHTLQYAALSMVERAFMLAISNDNTSEDAGDDQDAIWPIGSTGVPEIFNVEAHGLKADQLLTAFTPDL